MSKDGKPTEEDQRGATESFGWAGDIAPKGSVIRGQAIHPIKTIHPNEWPEYRVYFEDELRRAARTLVGKPLLLDHQLPLPGEVVDADYEDGSIEYVATLNDGGVLEKIRKGEIRHCSVEFTWRSLENVNGVAPRGINFTGLSLLERLPPGDPFSSVELWRKIAEALREHAVSNLTPPNPSPRGSGSETGEETRMDLTELEKLIESTFRRVLKEQEDEREKLREEQRKRAEEYGISPKEGGHLTKPSEYENIPEDQWADPVNWRYPVDREHVRAALTYFNQVDNRRAGGYSHEEAVKIMVKIIQAALNNGIEVSYQPEDRVYRDLPEGLKQELRGYEKSESLSAEAQKPLSEAMVVPEKTGEPTIKVNEIMAVIPDERVWRSWSYGPQRLIQDLKRVLREVQ